MAKRQFHQPIEMSIPAGDISRHPVSQRRSQLKKFRARAGNYDEVKNQDFIHVVPSEDGKWRSIDGGHRVENCCATPDYGPRHRLRCKAYGVGTVPTIEQCSELFCSISGDRMAVSSTEQFRQAVNANRPNAVEADKLIKKCGPTFRAPTGVWALVRAHGTKHVGRVIDEALAIWGPKEHMLLSVLKAISAIMLMEDGAEILKSRRRVLKSKTPAAWQAAATNTRLRQIGTREPLQAYVLKKLMGVR